MNSRRRTAKKSNAPSAGQGHEESLSFEETNKLRASLGLGPLKPKEPNADRGNVQITKSLSTGAKSQEAVDELKARVAEARNIRQQKQATLGDAGEDLNDEDMLAWIEKNRNVTSHEGSEKRRKIETNVVQGDDALKNAKVKGHSLEALDHDGEMILTLADKGILDESGNDIVEEDELLLENVRERENMEREQAIKASRKAKPLWEEDGVKRSMLEKYDEEEEEAFMLGDIQAKTVGTVGTDDMKDKLLAAKTSLLAPLKAIGGDYYTSEEVEKMKKPKKKKERKLKKKALTEGDIDDLEMAALEKRNDHLASKTDRRERMLYSAEEEVLNVAEKRSRFDEALNKANIASTALREDNPVFDGDEEDELAASLAKARSIALKKRKDNTLENLARQTIERREKQEAAKTIQNANDSLIFTDIGEFARSVGAHTLDTLPIKEEEKEEKEIEEAVKMEDDMDEKEQEDALNTKSSRKGTYRIHKDFHEDNQPIEQEEKAAIVQETKIGQGLGGVLSYLKERGELHKPVEWAGRTNDSRNAFFTGAMGGYKDVYTSGRSEDDIAANVEVALTRKDEYGRVLTPKEAFRQFCHNFHGIQPSQGSKEKRMRQAAKELAQKKAATGSIESGVVSNMKALQQKKSTPYMVLSGTVKPGQTRDAMRDD